MRNGTSPKNEPGLNPALKSTRDDTYDTARSTPPPVETASVQREEGRGWPVIWLMVFVICVLVALYILVW